jgi:transporter family-2 protein
MLSIRSLSPTLAISIILISQLMVAAIIDGFGLMDTKKITIEWTKYFGIFLMIIGVILFQLNLKK